MISRVTIKNCYLLWRQPTGPVAEDEKDFGFVRSFVDSVFYHSKARAPNINLTTSANQSPARCVINLSFTDKSCDNRPGTALRSILVACNNCDRSFIRKIVVKTVENKNKTGRPTVRPVPGRK